MKDTLLDLECLIIGDSAYWLKSFLFVPFDSPGSQTPEDDFSFYYSSACITLECAFGEIGLMWGIIWKHLKQSLENVVLIIEESMRQHSFLLDYRDFKIK